MTMRKRFRVAASTTSRLPNRHFQRLWAALHLSAAWLAATAAVMHIGSAIYHLRRIGEADPHERISEKDKTFD